MEQRSAAVSSAYYAVSNVGAEALFARKRDRNRYLRVRYEDAITDPVELGRQLSVLMDEPMDLQTVLPDGRHGVVHETHSAWGNPNRFETGPVTLRLDEAWRDAPVTRERRIVELLNGPLLRHYGYTGTSHGTPASS
jgi:hypothetical protein